MKDPEYYKYPPSSLWSVSFLCSPTASLNDFIRAPISGIKGLLPGRYKSIFKKSVASEQKSKMWYWPTGLGGLPCAPSPLGSTKTSNVFWVYVNCWDLRHCRSNSSVGEKPKIRFIF